MDRSWAAAAGTAAVAATAEVTFAAIASSAHLAEIHDLWQPLALVAAVALIPVLRSLLTITGTPHFADLATATGAGWFALAWVRHLLDLAPRWDGRLPSGLGHVAWDVGYHAPALVVVVVGMLASTLPARTAS